MKKHPSDEAMIAAMEFLMKTSVPRLLAKKDREQANVQNSPTGKD